MKSKRLFLITLLGAALSFPACGDWIYDEDDGEGTTITEHSFSRLNASAYTAWVYVNLETKEATLVDQYTEGNTDTPPEEWHLALHRWDCKTNGGAVLETGYTTLDALLAAGSLPVGDFVEDVWTEEQIRIEVSMVGEGSIRYAPSWYNAELSKWMNVDMSGMPPTYTPSNKVYIFRTQDGTTGAVRFTDYIGPSDAKGYISFEYIYPLNI